MGEGYLINSTASFTGRENCDFAGPQRWGDFNSTVWDPYLPSLSAKPSTFWNTVEYTNGGGQTMSSDQSSYWIQVNDPLPYYIGNNLQTVSECTNNANCTVTLTAPSGTQVGDILLADIGIGESTQNSPTLPDSTWTLLVFSNLGGATQATNSISCGLKSTGWLAAHVYWAGDLSQFPFSILSKNYTACGDTAVPGMGGLLTNYRDAGHIFANYGLTGYGTTENKKTLVFGPISAPTPANSAPPEGTLAVQVSLTGDGGNQVVNFTGTPALTPESAMGLYSGPFFNGQMSFGSYTATSNCVPASQLCGMINMALGIPGY